MAAIVEEIPGRLIVYSDGSVVRPGELVPASQQFLAGVATKDVVVDEVAGIQARIFLPHTTQIDAAKNRLLPVMLHFHGGGFCISSFAWSFLHNFLVQFALQADAICISVDYRLAPEHRLPSAYADCFAALKWVQSQAKQQAIGGGGGDPWLLAHADFTRCFLAGESAGGNIVHNLAIRISGEDLSPLQIKGLLVLQPFFFAMEKTQSELEAPPDAFITPSKAELYWRLALPIGAKRDYPPCNPWGPHSPNLFDFQFPRVLVNVATLDTLRDLGIKYYESLKQHGNDVQLVVSEGVDHIFQLLHPNCEQAELLLKQMAGFINDNRPQLRTIESQLYQD